MKHMELDDDEYNNVNDTYGIKADIKALKEKINEIERDVDKLLGPRKIKVRGRRARMKLAQVRHELIPLISNKILKTNQDYNSDYE